MHYQTTIVLLLAALALIAGAYAYSAGPAAPDNTMTASPGPANPLAAIIVSDNGVQAKISIGDVTAYHAKMEAEEDGTMVPGQPEIDPCCAWMYRSLSAGIRALWGDEIPQRSDISVASYLPSCGALHTGWYVTGTGPGMDSATADRFILLRPDGTELTDTSHAARSIIAKNRNADSYRIVLTRISTGESVTVALKEEAFPDRFFALFTKVKNDPAVTKEEVAEFNTVKNAFRDNLVQKPDEDLVIIQR
ncbi:MAG: hypothetical protein GYA23_01510 [Methanomicrobiales archaeon]|nr:hypothetical protein [Methanomicrobiales archaeon]